MMQLQSRFSKALPYLIIVLISILVYKEVVYHNFLSDDWAIIVRRKDFISNPANIRVLFLFPQKDEKFNFRKQLYRYLMATKEVSYRPLNTLSYFIDYRFWKLNPRGYHLTNLTIHTLNSLLVYQLGTYLTLGWMGGLVAGLIFTLHPVQIEPLAVVSFREDILACFFILLAVLLFLSANQKGEHGLKLIISAGCYFVAILCKENVLVYPFLILGLIFINKNQGISRSIKLYLLTIFLISILFGFIRFHYNPPVAINSSVLSAGLLAEILTVFHVMATYIQWVFVPLGIKFYLVNQAQAVSDFTPLILSDMLIVLIILGFLVYHILARGYKAGFAALWIIVNLIPLLAIRYLASMLAARYLYIPLIGFAIFIGILASYGWHRKKYILLGLIVLLVLSYGVITQYSLKNWENDLYLWKKMATDFPGDNYCNFQYHIHRGGFLYWQKEYIPALKEYLQAYQYFPEDKGVLQKIGDILSKLREYHQAGIFYSRCLQEGGDKEVEKKLKRIQKIIGEKIGKN